MPDFMHPENPPPTNDAFLLAAQDQSLLSAEDARTVHKFAYSNSLDSSEAALQTGMLKPIEVEIVEEDDDDDEECDGDCENCGCDTYRLFGILED